MSAKKCWSYSAGEWGSSRVRAYEDRRGGILVEFYERETGAGTRRRVRYSLGHRDRKLAQRKVNQIVAALESGNAVVAEDITVRQLFDIYVREVTPTKGKRKQQHDRMCAKMFGQLFGPTTRVTALSSRDWDNFIKLRRSGEIGPTGRRAGDRQIEYDLKFLRAVCNWALEAKVHGRVLLARSPFGVKSCRLPKEKNPKRPVIKEGQYKELLRISQSFDWRLGLALVLANETGHRRDSIRLLRWSDVDFAQSTILWRSENEKTGYEHVTPLSEEALEALSAARSDSAGIGDAWVFPSPRWPSRPASGTSLARWLKEAQEKAGLPSLGWHSFRRKFASELRHIPLKDLCVLGGWKDPKTVLSCYQVPDQSELRESLKARRTSGAEPSNSTVNSTDIAPRHAPLSTVTSLS